MTIATADPPRGHICRSEHRHGPAIRRFERGARQAPGWACCPFGSEDGSRYGECSTSGGPEPADDEPAAPSVAAGRPRAVRGAVPEGLPGHRYARRGQDDLRADARGAAVVAA